MKSELESVWGGPALSSLCSGTTAFQGEALPSAPRPERPPEPAGWMHGVNEIGTLPYCCESVVLATCYTAYLGLSCLTQHHSTCGRHPWRGVLHPCATVPGIPAQPSPAPRAPNIPLRCLCPSSVSFPGLQDFFSNRGEIYIT